MKGVLWLGAFGLMGAALAPAPMGRSAESAGLGLFGHPLSPAQGAEVSPAERGRGGRSTNVTLVVTGNYQGQLSPCGCTKPMSGGIRRLATLVSLLKNPVLVDSGGWVTAAGTQDVFKAETLAETLGVLKVGAALLTPAEQRLGDSTVENLAPLMNQPWLTPETSVEREGLWIGGDGSGSSEEPSRFKGWLANRPKGFPAVWLTTRELDGEPSWPKPRRARM